MVLRAGWERVGTTGLAALDHPWSRTAVRFLGGLAAIYALPGILSDMPGDRIPILPRLFASTICLAVCGLFILLWMRSYSREEGFVLGVTEDSGFICGSMNGVLTIQLVEVTGKNVNLSRWYLASYPPGEARWLPQNIDDSLSEKIERAFGFYFEPSTSKHWGLWMLTVPHWFPVLLAVGFASSAWVRWRFSLSAMLVMVTLLSVLFGVFRYSL